MQSYRAKCRGNSVSDGAQANARPRERQGETDTWVAFCLLFFYFMTNLAFIDTSKRIGTGPVPLRRADGGRAEIPALGFGTWELTGSTGIAAVSEAIETGYRHFDTARAYENEKEVGRALANSALDRSEYWLTSKAWREDLSPDGIRQQAEESLRDLGVDYLDLFLIHWPNPAFPLEETLEELQRLIREQAIRFAGVSNFTAGQWRDALGIQPGLVTNQVEYHPFLDQKPLIEIAREQDALLTAYSPLGSGEEVKPGTDGGDKLGEIGKKHGKSAAQVCLRWLLDQPEVVAIPRSSNPEHIRSNFEIFDFQLTEEDRRVIDELPKDRRHIHPKWAPAEWGPPRRG